MSEPDQIPARTEELDTQLHSWPWTYWQLLVVGTGREFFFSNVLTSHLKTDQSLMVDDTSKNF